MVGGLQRKKPTDPLYHLSHGHREPVGFRSALSQRRTPLGKANGGPIAENSHAFDFLLFQVIYCQKLMAIVFRERKRKNPRPFAAFA
jgi:hypothetical protein